MKSSSDTGAITRARPIAKLSARRGRRRVRAGPAIDVVVASPLWKGQRGAKALLRRAIGEAADAVSAAPGELAIVLTDDATIRTLNRNWRSKDTSTNVLSFPAPGRPIAPALARKARTIGHRPARHSRVAGVLGDIVIAYETMEREARAERKPFMHHLAHLAVHGYLHLVGYDHQANDEAQTMEGLETEILARLAVPDPYLVRSARD
jgi:probable rRNA maturation factor